MKIQLSVLLSTLLLAASCGKDEAPEITCTDEEYWDQVESVCVPRYRDVVADMGEADASGEVDMAEEVDLGSTNNGDNNVDPSCDADRDGVLSVECGGEDCDDTNPARSPNNPELCDKVDNDCDTFNNEGLNCTFYAHSGLYLYSVDPFQLTVTQLASELPNLQDIDTHPNGALLGVSSEGLFQYDDLRGYWFLVGDFDNNGPSDPNGMAIDLSGRAFVTSQDELYEIDIVEGTPTLVGDLGGDYYSSGDCVVNKQDSLYMTSKHDEATDWLLLIERSTGRANEVGPIGFTRVFALTAAWGYLYGLTDRGELIEIDSATGEGTLVHTFEGTRFFGAASTPSR